MPNEQPSLVAAGIGEADGGQFGGCAANLSSVRLA